jgi:hypothetical protein
VRRHRRAIQTITAALLLDAGCGIGFAAVQHIAVWLALYCALANAVTLGGTVPPSVPGGYMIMTAECLLIVPLFAATFSLFTSGLTAAHVEASEGRLKKHFEDRLRHHLGASGARAERLPPPDWPPRGKDGP